MRPSFGHGEHRQHRRHHRGPFRDPAELGAFAPPEAHAAFPPPPPRPPFSGWPGFPGEPGPGRGRGHRHGGRGGRRSRRGDVRAAILTLLVERPMHGYEMIQEITERSGQHWSPSPGSVYPTLQLLADEGLVVITEGSGGKRRYELTEEGRAAAARHEGSPPWDLIAQDVDPDDTSLRDAIGQLMGATAQVANAATQRQKKRAVEVLNNARRELYAILGETETDTATDED
jgi:DNA-binding PadR family transcriptional regulator